MNQIVKPFLTGIYIFGAIANASLETKAETPQTTLRQQLSQDNPKTLLARAIWGEARSCAWEEKVAVGYTAINRQKKSNLSLAEVLLSGYNCFKGVSGQQILTPHLYDNPDIFRQCEKIAARILTGYYQDPTNGATHFYKQGTNPYWAKSLKGKISIKTNRGLSKHIFGRTK